MPVIQLYTILKGKINKLTGIIFNKRHTPSTKVSGKGPSLDSFATAKDLQQTMDFPNNPNVLNKAAFSGFLYIYIKKEK